MSSACAEICQHPACWISEQDALRRKLTNRRIDQRMCTDNIFDLSNQKYKYEQRNQTIIESTGSLPTYNILNLLEHGFPISEDDSDEEDNHVSKMPQWSAFHVEQFKNVLDSAQPQSPQSASAKCLERLYLRQKEIETEERKNTNEIINFKTLHLDDAFCINDDFDKVYVFIPGKKSKRQKTNVRLDEDKTMKVKVIDGDTLPADTNDYDGERRRMRSQPNRHKSPERLPRILNKDSLENFDLLHLLDYPVESYMLTETRESDNVYVPSPLQTRQISLAQPRPHASRSCDDVRHDMKDYVLKTNSKDKARDKPVKDGLVLPRSHVNNKNQETSRKVLRLTKVSVPRKAIQKIPIFNHCSSSIKRTDLSQVAMQPLSSSENSCAPSYTSSAPSVMEIQTSLDDLLGEQVSSDAIELFRVPAPSPFITKSEPSLRPVTERHHKLSLEEAIKSIADVSRINDITCTEQMTQLDAKKHLSNSIVGHGEALVTSTSPIVVPTASVSNADLRNDSRVSTLSNHSSGEWTIDKDIIRRTYDTYDSLTPFKTPLSSQHVISLEKAPTAQSVALAELKSSTVNEKLLSQDRHDWIQFMPVKNQGPKANASFVRRSLSPSRSMFSRQQTTRPQEAVPVELKVSQAQIIRKAPLNREYSRYQKDNTGFLTPLPSFVTGITSPLSPHGENKKEPITKEDAGNHLVNQTVADEEREIDNEVVLKSDVVSCEMFTNTSSSLQDVRPLNTPGLNETAMNMLDTKFENTSDLLKEVNVDEHGTLADHLEQNPSHPILENINITTVKTLEKTAGRKNTAEPQTEIRQDLVERNSAESLEKIPSEKENAFSETLVDTSEEIESPNQFKHSITLEKMSEQMMNVASTEQAILYTESHSVSATPTKQGHRDQMETPELSLNDLLAAHLASSEQRKLPGNETETPGLSSNDLLEARPTSAKRKSTGNETEIPAFASNDSLELRPASERKTLENQAEKSGSTLNAYTEQKTFGNEAETQRVASNVLLKVEEDRTTSVLPEILPSMKVSAESAKSGPYDLNDSLSSTPFDIAGRLSDTARAKTPIFDLIVQDFTDGLDLELDVDEDILRVMKNMDDFVSEDFDDDI